VLTAGPISSLSVASALLRKQAMDRHHIPFFDGRVLSRSSHAYAIRIEARVAHADDGFAFSQGVLVGIALPLVVRMIVWSGLHPARGPSPRG
jgi:hypothetical protein